MADLRDIHEQALKEFDDVQSTVREDRLLSLQDRRFYSISGAQYEGAIGDQFENKPKFEVNKIHLAIIRIINEYRNNRVSVNFVSKDGTEYDKLADTCAGLFRADEQDSVATEAYDNAFEEAVGGGFGAWRLRNCYEDDEDDEDERQRIKIEPIYDADSSVFFDLAAKRQDKSDASFCFVISSIPRAKYEELYDDDVASWQKSISQYEYDWVTPDVVYVAEYYKVENKRETIIIYEMMDGSEERYSKAEMDADPGILEMLTAAGAREVRRKKVNRKRVHKYILSGGGVLEDCGYVAGKHIPIVPVYGKRWYVDNIERFMGHVRLAKDPQIIKNMQLSKLAEIAALSPVEKPIFTPEQVSGHGQMWADDNLKNYPYMLVNSMTGPSGEMLPSGPLGYTKPPQIPPALVGLLQSAEQDMLDILGNQQQADKVVSNISGKAVEMIQQRLDMQTFIYMSNFAKAVRRSGEIWLSMASEIYVEPGRKMKSIGAQGQKQSIELLRPTIGESGEIEYENDMSEAQFDVVADVGPSSESKRQATVRSLTGMMQVTQDPETLQVLSAMAVMNLDGEGVSDIRDYFRRRLLRMGVVKPTEDEAQQLQQEAQGQPEDPNAVYLKSAAEEAQAKAAKARADTIYVISQAELNKAKIAETMANLQREPADQPANVQDPIQARKSALELVKMARELEMAEERHAIDITNNGLVIERDENGRTKARAEIDVKTAEIGSAIATTVEALKDVVNRQSEIIQNIAESTADATTKQAESTEKVVEILRKPRKIIREKGRIVGMKLE